MAISTTGSTVRGLVPGLRRHFGGTDIMFVNGDPDSVVSVAPIGGTAIPLSGAVIAYDYVTDNTYRFAGGSSWMNLGSQT